MDCQHGLAVRVGLVTKPGWGASGLRSAFLTFGLETSLVDWLQSEGVKGRSGGEDQIQKVAG